MEAEHAQPTHTSDDAQREDGVGSIVDAQGSEHAADFNGGVNVGIGSRRSVHVDARQVGRVGTWASLSLGQTSAANDEVPAEAETDMKLEMTMSSCAFSAWR